MRQKLPRRTTGPYLWVTELNMTCFVWNKYVVRRKQCFVASALEEAFWQGLPISVGHLLDRRISRAVFKHTQPSLFFVNYFLYLFYLLLFKLVSKKEKDVVVFFSLTEHSMMSQYFYFYLVC
jgi:hypothetical protein